MKTQPATMQNLRHGALVLDHYNRIGLVTEVHYSGCQQSEDWIKGQTKAVSEDDLAGPWVDIAPLDGGGVHVAMANVQLIYSQDEVAVILRLIMGHGGVEGLQQVLKRCTQAETILRDARSHIDVSLIRTGKAAIAKWQKLAARIDTFLGDER